MKIVFAGGGTGGHVYPLFAVAEEIRHLVQEEHLLQPDLVYIGPTAFDPAALSQNNIKFYQLNSGKTRRYSTLQNILDLPLTFLAILKALVLMYRIFPDVVFSKGGYASVPVILAAKFFGIPVIIHESDSVPGRANILAAKFAKKIAISYEEAAKYFPKDKVALTGNPIRRELYMALTRGAHEFLHLDANIPTILILGGSQGAMKINDVVTDAIETLVKECNVIHQTGDANFEEVKHLADMTLKNSEHKERYKPFGHLDILGMRMAAGASDLIISRAGSTIFEIALWGKPSIIIPIPESISHDQTKNAFAYTRTGAATLLEEANLSKEILINECRRILSNKETHKRMSDAAKAFSRSDAAVVIARELLAICLEHEK